MTRIGGSCTATHGGDCSPIQINFAYKAQQWIARTICNKVYHNGPITAVNGMETVSVACARFFYCLNLVFSVVIEKTGVSPASA